MISNQFINYPLNFIVHIIHIISTYRVYKKPRNKLAIKINITCAQKLIKNNYVYSLKLRILLRFFSKEVYLFYIIFDFN